MKVCVWTNFPNHYQDSFYAALRTAGVDVRVRYYSSVPAQRKSLGWSDSTPRPADEDFLPDESGLRQAIVDADDRIHVVPGYGESILWKLSDELVRRRARWVHWSEPSRGGLRSWITWPIKRRYARRVNRNALGAFANGDAAIDDFRKWGIAANKIALLPYSAPLPPKDVSPDPDCAAFAAGRKAFVFLGSLIHRKGVDVLLKAFAAAQHDVRDWVLLLIGTGDSMGDYQQLAARLGVLDRVLFRGAVKPLHLWSTIAAADVAVLPSRFDGWGVALSEAASMGRALIASDRVGAARHLIRPGENGFRVRAGSVESLESALAAYGRDPNLARQHAAHSLTIAEDFTPGRNAERFQTAIQNWQALA